MRVRCGLQQRACVAFASPDLFAKQLARAGKELVQRVPTIVGNDRLRNRRDLTVIVHVRMTDIPRLPVVRLEMRADNWGCSQR